MQARYLARGLDLLGPLLRSILFLILTSLATRPAAAQIQQAWVARYNNGITNGTNQAVKMALDSNGNIYLTGFSQNANSNLGYVTIKYAPNGNQLWATRYDSTNYPNATPTALALDASNDVLVTGNALTVKYDPNGNQLWTASYSGSALATDPNGNVAVTGFGTGFNTAKLNPGGSNLWVENYSARCGPGTSQAIVADTVGNFYVAGSSPDFCQDGFTYYALLLLKYGVNGNQLWTATNDNGATHSSAQVDGAALDSSGNVDLLVDFSPDQPGSRFNTFSYTSDGALSWAAYPIAYWFVRQIVSEATTQEHTEGDHGLHGYHG